MRAPARPSTEPFFRITGGKRKLVPELLRLAPARFRTYREPFVGGGALFFALAPHDAVLSDSGPEIIASYLGVRDMVESVIDHLRDMMNTAEDYAAVQAREHFDEGGPGWEAARFLYLQAHSFNGLWRTNAAGKHNTSRDPGRRVDLDRYAARLRLASAALRGVDVRCLDFEEAMLDARSGDLVYCDPPYAPVSATSNFTSYTKEKFTEHDQRRLRDAARMLKRRGVRVLLSNSSAPLVRDLYGEGGEFELVEVLAARSVNSDGTKRGMVRELVIR